MNKTLLTVTAVCLAAITVACTERPTDMTKDAGSNVLLAEWTGPYGGVPAFDRMELEALEPALEIGMDKHLAEIDAIASNAEPATFDNTIVAMERSGRDLDRVMTYWSIWSANRSTPEFREIQQAMAPVLVRQ